MYEPEIGFMLSNPGIKICTYVGKWEVSIFGRNLLPGKETACFTVYELGMNFYPR
jgi:hypothetical protein